MAPGYQLGTRKRNRGSAGALDLYDEFGEEGLRAGFDGKGEYSQWVLFKKGNRETVEKVSEGTRVTKIFSGIFLADMRAREDSGQPDLHGGGIFSMI